jgi:hypothetical protein
MFHVLVIGGIALLGPAGCGGQTATSPGINVKDAAADTREDVFFPSELPSFVEAGREPLDAFPSELATIIDAGTADAGDDAGEDAFPSELPVFVEAGTIDATSDADVDAGFPIEK